MKKGITAHITIMLLLLGYAYSDTIGLGVSKLYPFDPGIRTEGGIFIVQRSHDGIAELQYCIDGRDDSPTHGALFVGGISPEKAKLVKRRDALLIFKGMEARLRKHHGDLVYKELKKMVRDAKIEEGASDRMKMAKDFSDRMAALMMLEAFEIYRTKK